MIKLTVDLNAELAKEALASLKAKMGNMTPVMRTVGQVIRASVQKNFETGGRPTGWVKLSPVTTAGKKRGKGGHKILVDTARLKNSPKVKASANEVTVGTNLVYAAIQHFGGMAGRGQKVKIPARPYMLIQPEDWDEINREASEWLLKR